MKFFLALFAVIVISDSANAVTKELLAKISAAKDKCIKEFRVDYATIQAFMRNKILPTFENGKCALNCWMEELNLLTDGKMNIDAFKSLHKEKWEEASVVAKADQIVEECNDELVLEEKNKCDAAVEVFNCILTKSKEMDIPPLKYKNPTKR